MKDLKKLKSELKDTEERIAQIGPEREKLQERLEAAKKKHSQIETQITELRGERQDLLVAEEGLEDVNARLKEVRKSEEILEDEIQGLSRTIESLNTTDARLADLAIDLRKDIVKEGTLRPLVVEYNKLAPELAEVLKKIYAAIDTYRRDFNSPAQRVVEAHEGNIGPRILPGIWLPGEDPAPNYYDRAVEASKRQAQANEKTMKERYPDCRCFRCANYAGVSPHLTVHCEAIKGEIPGEILAGQKPTYPGDRWAMFYRQCSFTPVN